MDDVKLEYFSKNDCNEVDPVLPVPIYINNFLSMLINNQLNTSMRHVHSLDRQDY